MYRRPAVLFPLVPRCWVFSRSIRVVVEVNGHCKKIIHLAISESRLRPLNSQCPLHFTCVYDSFLSVVGFERIARRRRERVTRRTRRGLLASRKGSC